MELAGIPLGIWGGFMAFVFAMLALDLGVFHRHSHEVKIKEALVWSAVWIGLAFAFNAGLYFFWDQIQPGSKLSNSEAGTMFLAGFLIEKALSVDNLFVFIVIFTYFNVPKEYQHRVLFFGILGALLFRAVFVAAGATLLHKFHWLAIVFGVFLILTGIKMMLTHGKKMEPDKNLVVKLFRKLMPVTPEYHGQSFFKRINGKLWATPLFLVLILIEFTDVVFAVDSIPAIFAITSDPFIVFTSNVFAILGLRALYFALAGIMGLFHYLSYGLAGVLVFVGGKMIYGYWQKFPVGWSLAIIVGILGASILASLWKQPRAQQALQEVEDRPDTEAPQLEAG